MPRSLIATVVRRAHAALVWSVLLPVALYRRFLSPLKRTPTCRFVPTCSQYAVDAVKTRGIVVGVPLALWRILRCNPLVRGGYDPVPAARGLHPHCAHCSEEGHAGSR